MIHLQLLFKKRNKFPPSNHLNPRLLSPLSPLRKVSKWFNLGLIRALKISKAKSLLNCRRNRRILITRIRYLSGNQISSNLTRLRSHLTLSKSFKRYQISLPSRCRPKKPIPQKNWVFSKACTKILRALISLITCTRQNKLQSINLTLQKVSSSMTSTFSCLGQSFRKITRNSTLAPHSVQLSSTLWTWQPRIWSMYQPLNLSSFTLNEGRPTSKSVLWCTKMG